MRLCKGSGTDGNVFLLSREIFEKSASKTRETPSTCIRRLFDNYSGARFSKFTARDSKKNTRLVGLCSFKTKLRPVGNVRRQSPRSSALAFHVPSVNEVSNLPSSIFPECSFGLAYFCPSAQSSRAKRDSR